MDKKEILMKLKTVLTAIQPDIRADAIGTDSSLLLDLHINSINMMVLAFVLEDKFSVRFEENPHFDTVGDVVDWLYSHSNP